jgi:tetratricopeptide (TPR) repeat protein
VGRTEDELPFIVMELIRGRTLRQLLVGRPLLTLRALEYAVQATEGLARAHAAGIIHRDIKPENIMISDDGFVKIVDFGLAKLVGPLAGRDDSDPDAETDPDGFPRMRDETPAAGHTAAGDVLGTASYMSPEQARGQSVDFRSDQFSCGATLYEIATGRRAFARATTADTLASIIGEEPEPIAAINPDVPAPFRWVVERCLAKDPGERYASTLDLARELRTVRDKLSEVTTVVGYTAPGPRPGRRWLPALVATTVLFAGAVLVPAVREPLLRVVGLPAVPSVRHVAVLPFTMAGGGDAAFVEGLRETLTSRLTQLERFQGSLWVVPALEVRQARLGSVAEALGTFGSNLVLSGSAERIGDRLRIHANLVDGRTLRLIRSITMEAPTAEPLAWQEEFVDKVAAMLEVEVGPEARRALRAGGTRVSGAYENYLEGRAHLARFEDIDSIDRALASFQRASQEDPSYALAYAGIGEASWRRYELTKQPGSAELAQKACQKSVALNDLLAPVHVTMGLVHAGTGRHEEALRDFERALALDPGNGEASRETAKSQEALGRLEAAEATYRKAIVQKPDYWAGPNALGAFLYRYGRYAEAEVPFVQALALAPDNVRVLSNLGGLYQVLGRPGEAQGMLERAVKVRPDPDAFSNLASLQFERKRFAEAAGSLDRAVALRPGHAELWRNLAGAYALVPGGGDKAKAAFEQARQLGEGQLATNPKDPDLLMLVADCETMTGRAAAARTHAEQALKLAPGNVNLQVEAAVVFDRLGDRKQAIVSLERAVSGGYPVARLEKREDLAGVRQDPAWRELTLPRARGTPTRRTK